VPSERITAGEVFFPAEEVKHLVSVLRRKPGDVVWAVDGKGGAFEVSLSVVTRREVRGKILRSEANPGEPGLSVTLAAGLIKGGRFDWLVEKAVELGASRIIPFLSLGSVAGKPAAGKTERWRKLALAAMKQCGRSVWPEVSAAVPLEEVVLSRADYGLAIAAHAGPDCVPLADAVRSTGSPVQNALLVVGPEGGFFPAEIGAFRQAGFAIASLGPRRLRAETAAMALLAQVFLLTGEGG